MTHLVERDYDPYWRERFPNLQPVRAFRDCEVWSAGTERPQLVLVDALARRLAIADYCSREDRERDIRTIRAMPDNDGPAVPAALHPNPPRRAPGAALRLPGGNADP